MSYFNKWTISFLIIGMVIYGLSPELVNLFSDYSAYSLRKQLLFLTGTLTFSMMTLAVIISIRFTYINKMMGGLDKAYIVHKTAGTLCLFFSIIHWLLKKAPHWFNDFFIITRPAHIEKPLLSSFETLLIKTGNTVADYTFYVVIILILIALIHKISYRLFRLTHKLFPLIYLLIAYHALTIQLSNSWFKTSSGFLLSTLACVGIICAVIALLQLIGYNKKIVSIIKQIDLINKDITSLTLKLTKPIHVQDGQFVFLRFAHSPEPHPFSIVSSDTTTYHLEFAIKPLGDFTRQLQASLKVGQTVSIEGPYGELTFNDSAKKHMYIAGGIGITPFISRLNSLAIQHDNTKHIILWYCTKGELSQQFPNDLMEKCERAHVELNHINSIKNNCLIKQLSDQIDINEQDISIWFCGPAGLLEAVKKVLKDKNIKLNKLHYDNFKMR